MESDIQVSVIIPTLSEWASLKSCLESIASDGDAPPHEVLVVFNAAMPPEMSLTAHHPRARAVQNNTNLGFAEACNIGALEAVGKTLIFLNDDMTVHAGWMGRLIEPVLNGDWAASGGRVLSADGKKIDFAGASTNLLGWGFQKGHGEPVNSVDDEFSSQASLPFACGGNFAIKAGVYESCDGFDRDYFAYYEDVDLGWRLRLMEEGIAYVPEAVVSHAGGQTGSHMPRALKWYLQERNALQTVIKNYSDEILPKILPIAMGMVAVRSQILSLIELENLSGEKSWRQWILSDFIRPEKDHEGGIGRFIDQFKDTAKAGLKALKVSSTVGWEENEAYAQAGLFALEWCLQNWDRLMEKRGKVQAMRKAPDRHVITHFEDPLRPVLGHPREVEAMKPLEDIFNAITSGGLTADE